VLQRHLASETNGLVRFHVLRGLGRAASDHPEVPLDRAIIEDSLGRTLEACLRLAHWQQVLRQGLVEDPRRRTDGHELLASLLRDKQAHALERAFRILGLQLRGENVQSIYRGLRSSKPRSGGAGAAGEPHGPPARGTPSRAGGRHAGANLLAAPPVHDPGPCRSCWRALTPRPRRCAAWRSTTPGSPPGLHWLE
jgi:hypothetical protein